MTDREIQIFSIEGHFVDRILSDSPGKFIDTSDITVDSNNNLVVAVTGNNHKMNYIPNNSLMKSMVTDSLDMKSTV